MSEDRDVVNRRKVLKKSATSTGIGIIGSSQSVFAARNTKSNEQKQLEKLDEVQLILNELEEEKLPGIEKFETIESNSSDVVLTKVEFPYGTMRVGKVGNTIEAAFEFSDSENSNIYSSKPPKKYREIPGEGGWLLSDGDEIVFRRNATRQEQEAALAESSLEEDEVVDVYAESGIAGLKILSVDESGDEFEVKEYIVHSDSDSASIVSTEISSLKDTELIAHSSASSDDLSTNVTHNSVPDPRDIAEEFIESESIDDPVYDCGTQLTWCVRSIAVTTSSCARCAPGCLGSPTGVGAAICVICVLATCSHLITGGVCIAAMDCLDENGHI
ncbi:hypothetical protein [Natrarchaeobius oligotrophus]|uniref:hypothetical protein n=1 Tax=Natrarchaeobius oligotrophus TaxID=3455743 RepID=UPI000F540367|nr:hypothetical protein [Natrarchaeobius chitinivorans]